MRNPRIKFTRLVRGMDGQLRKHFKMWKIPQEAVREYDLRDGLHVWGSCRYGDLAGKFDAILTSGCEFSVGFEMAQKIQSHYEASPSSIIKFVVKFDETASIKDNFEAEVRRRIKANETDRLKKLAGASKLPQLRIVQTVVFDRNPDVVAQRLFEAEGTCDDCLRPAPFKRSSDKSPYLEVHHIQPLSAGGEDTVENTVALCPNCHRERHFGVDTLLVS